MEELEKEGFELNPYDPCVANKTIAGKQCTIMWYVDDCKISHVDEEVVLSVIHKLEDRFGKMSVNTGKRHKVVGMNITYEDDGTASIDMKKD